MLDQSLSLFQQPSRDDGFGLASREMPATGIIAVHGAASIANAIRPQFWSELIPGSELTVTAAARIARIIEIEVAARFGSPLTAIALTFRPFRISPAHAVETPLAVIEIALAAAQLRLRMKTVKTVGALFGELPHVVRYVLFIIAAVRFREIFRVLPVVSFSRQFLQGAKSRDDIYVRRCSAIQNIDEIAPTARRTLLLEFACAPLALRPVPVARAASEFRGSDVRPLPTAVAYS